MAGIFLFSLVTSFAIIWLLLRSNLAGRIATDIPNGRSLHAHPIPRIGGWGVVPAVVLASFFFDAKDWPLAVLCGALFVVSYVDDRVNLPIVVRLPLHTVAAAAWLALGPANLPIGIAALAAFAIVWVTNLFNFMDGADGLAGGMALFGFSAYAFVAAVTGLDSLALWSLAIAGASLGFLVFNFPPARVFLGDAGSVTLGFLAGVFGIWGWSRGAWPVWFPFMVSSPFFLDATVTILRRMFSGERFWKAHREHYYQRLIRSGWTHRRTAVCEYALMAGSAGLAVIMLKWSAPAQYVGLAAVAVIYVALAYAVDRRWAAFQGDAADKSEPLAELSGATALSGHGHAPRLGRVRHTSQTGELEAATPLRSANAVRTAVSQDHHVAHRHAEDSHPRADVDRTSMS